MTFYHWLGIAAEEYQELARYGPPRRWMSVEADGFITIYPEIQTPPSH